MIFGYLGPEPAPVLPPYDNLVRTDCHRVLSGRESHVNWLQRAENILDYHHIPVLHASVYPELAMQRPDVTWERNWYGCRQVATYANGATDVQHLVFPDRDPRARDAHRPPAGATDDVLRAARRRRDHPVPDLGL